MEKFQWSLLKTLEFINSRRPDLEIRANFLQQLQQYTRRSKTTVNYKDGKRSKKTRTQRSEDWYSNMTSLAMYKDVSIDDVLMRTITARAMKE